MNSVLYHASPEKNLELIKPRRTLSKDKYIGDYVFATADKMLATMYLATKGIATLMETKNGLWIAICSTAEDYLANDKGGAIYELPADTFSETPQKELSDFEHVSRVAVKPLSKQIYEKSMDAFSAIGANVYFVNQATFDTLVATDDELDILSELQPY